LVRPLLRARPKLRASGGGCAKAPGEGKIKQIALEFAAGIGTPNPHAIEYVEGNHQQVVREFSGDEVSDAIPSIQGPSASTCHTSAVRQPVNHAARGVGDHTVWDLVRVERPLKLGYLLALPKPLREQRRHGRPTQQRPVEIEDHDRILQSSHPLRWAEPVSSPRERICWPSLSKFSGDSQD
jgi:hypothetical protein